MAARTLSSSPHLLPLYARSAAPLIPGASLLPFVPGGGKRIPEIELLLPDVRADADRVAAYAKVCGFALREHLPITYPHVLAFPLQMAVMADGRFPFGAVGLVHIENRIVQHRPIEIGERLQVKVAPTELVPHPRGRAFTLVTEVSAGGETVWEGFSTMLRRGGGGGESEQAAPAREPELQDALLEPSAIWRLPGDLGRRYAGVSGDRNPIHIHPISAKLFGFPGAIAHGMWSKARCLAALESRVPDAVEASVRFRKPIVLPTKVQFASSLSQESDDAQRSEIRFALGDAKKGTPHLDGSVRPVEQTKRSKAK
jgi:acyl dehydratase